jgi:hypothetical protein
MFWPSGEIDKISTGIGKSIQCTTNFPSRHDHVPGPPRLSTLPFALIVTSWVTQYHTPTVLAHADVPVLASVELDAGMLRGVFLRAEWLGSGSPPDTDLSCWPTLPPVEPACANNAFDVAVTASAVRIAIPIGATEFVICARSRPWTAYLSLRPARSLSSAHDADDGSHQSN